MLLVYTILGSTWVIAGTCFLHIKYIQKLKRTIVNREEAYLACRREVDILGNRVARIEALMEPRDD